VSLKQTRAFRSLSFIAIVALIAGPIEDDTIKAEETAAQNGVDAPRIGGSVGN
jgi:hypothetical protein